MGTLYTPKYGRWPKMCYNAPHLKQLGWVQLDIRTIPHANLTTSYTNETLYGFYTEIKEGVNSKEMIIITGLTPTSNPDTNKYCYISCNAIKGPNTETLMGENYVLVHYSSGVGRSELVTQLRLKHDNYSNEYPILTNSEYITIEVFEINTVEGYAKVGVKKIVGGGNDIKLETPTPSPALIQ